VFVEDQEQLAKIREVEDDLPSLEFVIVIDAEGDIGDAIPFDELRARGPAGATTPSTTSGSSPSDATTSACSSTRRARRGPPKGCILTHGQLPRRS